MSDARSKHNAAFLVGGSCCERRWDHRRDNSIRTCFVSPLAWAQYRFFPCRSESEGEKGQCSACMRVQCWSRKKPNGDFFEFRDHLPRADAVSVRSVCTYNAIESSDSVDEKPPSHRIAQNFHGTKVGIFLLLRKERTKERVDQPAKNTQGN